MMQMTAHLAHTPLNTYSWTPHASICSGIVSGGNVAFFPVALCPMALCPGGILSSGILSGDILSGGILSGSRHAASAPWQRRCKGNKLSQEFIVL